MGLNIDLLEASFKLVTPRADELADRFYHHLFEEHPEVRPMFTTPMHWQKKKMVASLTLIVSNLRNPEQLTEVVGALGLRHVAYGTQREHYPVVGAILVRTLAEIAGDAWTDEMEQAWTEAYEAITQIIFAALDRQEKQAA